MKLNTPKACHTLGLVFFAAMTVIEVVMFCSVFSIFELSWIRMAGVGISTIVFNGALWFFALAYYKTLENVKNGN